MKVLLLSLLFLVGCASSETKQTERELNEECCQEETKKSEPVDSSVYETLCGEYSVDSKDCKKAARDVCKNHRIKVVKVKERIQCDKLIENKESEGNCKKLYFRCID